MRPRVVFDVCGHLLMIRGYKEQIKALAPMMATDRKEALRLQDVMEGYIEWYAAEHRAGCRKFRERPRD